MEERETEWLEEGPAEDAEETEDAEGSERAAETILRLAKPVRKGFLHLVFSRFLIIALLLVLQVLLMVVFYGWVNQHITHIASGLRGIFTISMVIYLFNIPMDSSAKLTWMLLISLFPLPGAALLAFTQGNFGHRLLQYGVEQNIEATRDALPQPEGVLETLEQERTGTEDLVRYLNRSGCFPAYDDSEVTYYPSGEAKFAALLEELQKAERFIYMEYFIIEEGYMWGRVLEILTEKVRQGVEVRVLYDGMCEMFQLPPGYWKLLEQQGIRAKPFAEIRPIVSSHYNYRDHRKILVIDGRVAFTGGVNLADEYINRVERFGHWKDTALRIRGSAAQSFTLMFLQMWNVGEGEKQRRREAESGPRGRHEAPTGADAAVAALQRDVRFLKEVVESGVETGSAAGEAPGGDYARIHTGGDAALRPSGIVVPYCDCPLDGEKVGETVYMDVLYRATDYVHIMTPYLILDGELQAALRYAAERGVDVKIILPGVPDKKMAYALAKSHYRDLLRAGVKLYEYTPGFVHAKVFVSDDEKAVVGTINLDYRSLYHHFECAAYLHRTDCIPAIEQDFQATLAQCREVTPESIKNEKLYYRVMGSILKFVAPLM